MAGSLLPNPKQTFTDNAGNPLIGGQLFTYAPGTLTPKATYQDAALTIANTNPAVTNARGEVVLYGRGSYRIILKDAQGNTIYDRDNIESAQSLAVAEAEAAAASAAGAAADAGKAAAAKIAAEAARDAALLGQSSGVIGKDTLANLNADLAHAAGTVAYVTNDATTTNNGTYRKTGASGAGSWAQSNFDRVALVETDVLRRSKAAVTIDNPYFEEPGTGPASSTTMYIKGSTFYVRISAPDVTVAWAAGASFFGASITGLVTSPLGVADCLALPHNSYLVWDFDTKKLEILTDRNALSKNQLLLIEAVGGRATRGYWAHLSSWYAFRQRAPITLNRTLGTYAYFNLGNSTVPTIEEGGSRSPVDLTLYLKHQDMRLISTGINLFPSWTTIKTDINDATKFVTSPKGVADCMKLVDEAYVYDITDSKFKIIGRTAYDVTKHIAIAISAYGALIDGLLLKWSVGSRFRTTDQSLASLQSQLSSVSAATNRNLVSRSHGIKFIAHRGLNGNSVIAPENTLPAYRLAGEYGYWGAECDILQTSDGQWVLMHDDTVDRTTNGTGRVDSLTLAQIRALDASKLSAAYGYSDVPVPTLDEFLEVCERYSMVPVIELKSVPAGDGVTKLLDSIKRSVGVTGAIIISFSTAALQAVRNAEPGIPMHLVCNAITQTEINAAIALGNCDISASHSVNTYTSVKPVLDAGLRAAAWTVGPHNVRGAIAKGFTLVSTDDGLPLDTKAGYVESVTRNADDFSNFVIGGNPAPVGGALTSSEFDSRIDIPAAKGDVIALEFEGKTTATADHPKFWIQGLDSAKTVVATYFFDTVTSPSWKPDGVTVIATGNIAYARIIFAKGTGGPLIVRKVKITRRKV